MVAAVWTLLMALIASGVVPFVSDDLSVAALFAVPALAFLTMTLTRPFPSMPSEVLSARPWSSRPGTGRLLRPCGPGALAAASVAGGAYLGALASVLRSPRKGLGRLLLEPNPYLDWYFPLLAAGAAICAGCLFVLAVLLPLRALFDARTQWRSNRAEARRLLAFVLGVAGLTSILVAIIVIDPGPGPTDVDSSDRFRDVLRAMLMLAQLLLGTAGFVAAEWVARAGSALIFLALIVYWRWRPERRS